MYILYEVANEVLQLNCEHQYIRSVIFALFKYANFAVKINWILQHGISGFQNSIVVFPWQPWYHPVSPKIIIGLKLIFAAKKKHYVLIFGRNIYIDIHILHAQKFTFIP